MDEQSDALKEYVKCLEAEHRTFMEDCVKRPNKELDEALNSISKEAQFLYLLIFLYDVVRRQNEQTNSKEKDDTKT